MPGAVGPMASPVAEPVGVSPRSADGDSATLKRCDFLSEVPSLGEGDCRRSLHLRRDHRGLASGHRGGGGPAHAGAPPLVREAAGDSEPFHPAEPDQTFDGPAAIYSATVATSRPASLPRYGGGAGSRRYNGGAVPTS